MNEKADQLGKKSGFIKRKRKMTGSSFVKTLLFTWFPKPNASVEAIARAGFTHGLNVSAQAIDKRFTEDAGKFLKSLLETAVCQIIVSQKPDVCDIYSRFTNIYLADCSTITLPDSLADRYKGVGGTENASSAALKIDTRLELKTGHLQFNLLDGKHSDSRCNGAEAIYEPGSLRLEDLGYFKLSRFKERSKRGEYWLSRLQPGTRIVSETGEKIDLPGYLFNLNYQGVIKHEMTIKVGSEEQVLARLLLWKVPTEQAGRRRAKMKENAQNQGRQPTTKNLALCDWNLMITNAEQNRLSFEEAYVLYGVRWQIELLFKLWKTHGRLGHSKSQNPERILCELYVKLLGVLVQHWLCLVGLWQNPHRSLVKGCQMLKEQAERLAHCLNDLDALIAFLQELTERFRYGCSLNSRKRKPNTSQRIDGKHAFY